MRTQYATPFLTSKTFKVMGLKLMKISLSLLVSAQFCMLGEEDGKTAIANQFKTQKRSQFSSGYRKAIAI
jgi:hypothetical protein